MNGEWLVVEAQVISDLDVSKSVDLESVGLSGHPRHLGYEHQDTESWFNDDYWCDSDWTMRIVFGQSDLLWNNVHWFYRLPVVISWSNSCNCISNRLLMSSYHCLVIGDKYKRNYKLAVVVSLLYNDEPVLQLSLIGNSIFRPWSRICPLYFYQIGYV